MSSLRWIERNGKMVLQQNGGINRPMWIDVPIHQEPKPQHSYRCASLQASNLNCDCYLAYPHPPNQEVDMLVEELAHGFRNYAQIGKDYEWTLADYAVKFFKSRMPKESTMDCTANFNAGIRKCRTALFGEE